MKIVFLSKVTREFNGETLLKEALGGTHSSLILLSEELAKLGHEIFIFCNCKNKQGLFNGVNYIDINKIVKFAKDNDIDVLVTVASESILKARIKAKKSIAWLHNDYSPYWDNELSDIASQISYYMGVLADKVITTSKWQSEIIKNVFKIPENHIKKIPLGVNLDFFNNQVERNSKKIIYTSVPDRGLDILLKIFPRLRKEIPNLELHAFSSFKTWGKDDKKYTEIEEEIFSLANQEDVFLHEPISINLLAQELSSSYLCLYPSHSSTENYFNAETFCLSVLEAMTAGLPIIASNRGALSELIINEKTGVLIDAEPYSQDYQEKFILEALKILKDENLWKNYSSLAREKAENYSWSKIALKWDSFLKKLLLETDSTKLLQAPLKQSFPIPKVSIITPVYNRAKNLFHVLNALTKQSFKEFEIIISDDGSTDNTKEIVNSFRDKLNIRYSYIGENKGFRAARARNKGLERVRGEITIFLDSDVIVPPRYIEHHVNAHKKYDKILVDSFVYRMKEYKENDLGLAPKEYIKKHRDNLNDDIKTPFNIFDKEPIEEGYFLDSNSLSIKTEHILKDGFDENFIGWGHEDTELGYRYIQKGFRFLFIKEDCESYHIYHGISPTKDEETAVNWKRLAEKYKLKTWYDPLPKINVQGLVKLDGVDLEKINLLSNTVQAIFSINVRDKITAYPPFKIIKVDNGIIKEIK